VIELLLVFTTVFGFADTPFKDKFTVFPELQGKYWFDKEWYTGVDISSRTTPSSLNSWNPQTALWRVRIGKRVDRTSIEIGHQSEHGIGQKRPTESYDFVRVSYQLL